MPKVRIVNHGLFIRGKVWWFKKRVPIDVRDAYGAAIVQESTKEKDIKEARKVRDSRLRSLEKGWRAIRTGIAQPPKKVHPLLIKALERRKSEKRDSSFKFSNAPSHRDILLDELDFLTHAFIQKHSGTDYGDYLSELDRYEAHDELAKTNEHAKVLIKAVDVSSGELPISLAGEVWFAKADKSKATEREYGRTYKRAEEFFGSVNAVTPDGAREFIQGLAEDRGLSRKSVGNAKSAMVKLWGHLGKPKHIWNDFDVEFSNKGKPKRVPWTDEDVRRLYEACDTDWLLNAMVIAAHTGMREIEVASFEYDRKTDWIMIPRTGTKTDAGERVVPCPDAIRPYVQRWVKSKRSKSSICNRFTELKQGLGFGEDKVFHCFRNRAITLLTQLAVDPAHVAWIVGHVAPTFTGKTYAPRPQDLEILRSAINKIPVVLPLDADYATSS